MRRWDFGLSRKRTRETDSADEFEALFNQHWQRVWGVLARLVGDTDKAEDLALEAFLKLHERMQSLDQQEPLAGWLYRVATNLGLNAIRSDVRRRRYEEQAVREATITGGAPDLERDMIDGQTRRQVETAMQSLHPRSARLLILKASGLSYAEIAEAVGVAPSSVGALLARAQRELISRVEAENGE
jgi:RNA polymerase sigma-70 factor (ECF subfamily)